MGKISNLFLGAILLLLNTPLLGQIKKGTVFSTGYFKYQSDEALGRTRQFYGLQAGIFVTESIAAGLGFNREKQSISSAGDYSFNALSYYLLLRSNYNLTPGLNVFFQPIISRGTRENSFQTGTNNSLEKVIYSGRLEFGLTAFLSSHLAVEVIPVSLIYSNTQSEINEYKRKLREEQSDFGLSILPSPTSLSLKFFLFNEKLNHSKEKPLLRDKKFFSLNLKYHKSGYDSLSQNTEFVIAPSLMVYHSSFFGAGLSLGINHSAIKFYENNTYIDYSSTILFFDPFLRFNIWVNSKTALFGSPYAKFGIALRQNKSTQNTINDMLINLEGGLNLGISVLITPKIVMETYTNFASYGVQENLNEDMVNIGRLRDYKQIGLDLTNLYLSVGFLFGKQDTQK